MTQPDMFNGLARHYDALMAHVDYDHWEMAAVEIARLLPEGQPQRHLDAACGTGVLSDRLHRRGWHTVGFDLSKAMLDRARSQRPSLPVVRADLRAVPFAGAFDYVTCLFDSLNFLLSRDDLLEALKALTDSLRPGGIIYFDIVTEKMVLDYFAGQEWTESSERFRSAWASRYDRKARLSETEIRINRGPTHTIRERPYEPHEVEELAHAAGLELLGVYDAESWKPVRRKTNRADFVAVKGAAKPHAKGMKDTAALIRRLLK
jgi:SAM-dependent methyltransferase